jgi:hypothetical protein
MYLGICIAEFSAVYPGISSSVSRTIPLLISNYSGIYIKIIPSFITEFLMAIESLVNTGSLNNRFSVVVKALNVETEVMDSNPGINKD